MVNISYIRLGFFIGGLMGFGLLQKIIPSRPFSKDRWQYMLSNLSLVLFNNIVVFLLPLIPIGAAMQSEGHLLTMELPILLEVLILDLVIYFQHRLFHQVNFLWKIHAMHHVDPMLDTTSGFRFHPIEIVISNFIKVAVILLLGIAPISVIIFEVALNFLAMFNHSNLKLPSKLEKYLSEVLITPALHTIHHSKAKGETNSNYGFSVPWWDMLFRTFKKQGEKSQEKILIGTYISPKKSLLLFPGMLIQPFKPFK